MCIFNPFYFFCRLKVNHTELEREYVFTLESGALVNGTCTCTVKTLVMRPGTIGSGLNLLYIWSSPKIICLLCRGWRAAHSDKLWRALLNIFSFWAITPMYLSTKPMPRGSHRFVLFHSLHQQNRFLVFEVYGKHWENSFQISTVTFSCFFCLHRQILAYKRILKREICYWHVNIFWSRNRWDYNLYETKNDVTKYFWPPIITLLKGLHAALHHKLFFNTTLSSFYKNFVTWL
jgi:hypothetical protein